MTAPLAAVTDHKYFSDDALVSIFNVVLKVAFFQNILWCSSDPQTLEKNHWSVLELILKFIAFFVHLHTFFSIVYFLTNQEVLFRK